eukprot:1124030-Prymnesium_polylepis.1
MGSYVYDKVVTAVDKQQANVVVRIAVDALQWRPAKRTSPVVTFPSEEGPRPQEPGLVITRCLASRNASAARGQLRRLDVTAAAEITGSPSARSIAAFLKLSFGPW